MDEMDGFIEQLRGLVERGRRAQAALDALDVGRPNDRPAKRKSRRNGSGPIVSQARVLGALEQGANNVSGIAVACGMGDAKGRSRTSSVLHNLKQSGLVRRRGRGKWGLTAAGQERVKTP